MKFKTMLIILILINSSIIASYGHDKDVPVVRLTNTLPTHLHMSY